MISDATGTAEAFVRFTPMTERVMIGVRIVEEDIDE